MNPEASDIIRRGLKHIWHPCSQMKDYEAFLPLEIDRAEGSYLILRNGQRVIDAISSWWCKSLGHGHPRLKQALLNQADRFEHVIMANTTNDVIVALSEKLVSLTKNLNKVFYASEGSSAVEIALKMSLHSHQLQNQLQRNFFMALENSYHGETALTLSVSDVKIYRQPYQSILTDTAFIKSIPYVKNITDPLWNDCSAHWPSIEKQLNQHADRLTAIIIEPILQGAGGMLMYSRDFLHRLRQWTQKNNVHLIADEIMTGMGRTGYALACQHADIEPDFVCLGKGLTSGWLPLSAVLTSQKIYDLFYDDYATGKAFLHSHTYSGNALAASVALECLNIMDEENIYAAVRDKQNILRDLMKEVAMKTGVLKNIRNIGAMVAADLIVDDLENGQQRKGFEIYKTAVQLGALLRPLGNTIYWLPPLNIERHTLNELQQITLRAIEANY